MVRIKTTSKVPSFNLKAFSYVNEAIKFFESFEKENQRGFFSHQVQDRHKQLIK